MGQTVFPLPATGNTGPTPPAGYRQSVFDGQLSGGVTSSTKLGTFPANVYRVESVSASLAPFVFTSNGQSYTGSTGTPLVFSNSISTSQMSIAKPADGATWSAGGNIPSAGYWWGVAYGNSTYVAVSTWGGTATSSNDGAAWTVGSSPGMGYAITYANGLFCRVGDGNSCLTSPNGITWTQRTLNANNNWRSIAGGDGSFVAVTRDTNSSICVYSTDNGTTWTSSSLGYGFVWRSVAYGNGRYVAIAASTNLTVVSVTKGASWSTGGNLPHSGEWNSITYANGLFVAVAYTTQQIATSPDGSTWTARTIPSAGGGFLWITNAGGMFVIVTQTGSSALTSVDGITWTLRTLPSSSEWRSVAGSGTGFVTVSGSYNGVNAPTAVSSGTSNTSVLGFSVFPA